MSVATTINAIEVRNVHYAIGDRSILRSVTFAVPQGCCVAIAGPNGGGKSTLLSLILGILKPQSGEISVLGMEPRQARRRGTIGYVPQRIAQEESSFPFSVEELVWTGRATCMGRMARRKEEDRRAVARAMAQTNVSHLRSRRIGSLSGGERQRAYIARSIAAHPLLLLLDEPTTGIDARARKDFFALLRALQEESHMTILLVTHDMSAISAEVSYVLGVSETIVCHCKSHAFLTDDTLRRLYGSNIRCDDLPHTHQ